MASPILETGKRAKNEVSLCLSAFLSFFKKAAWAFVMRFEREIYGWGEGLAIFSSIYLLEKV